ncbi:hypothetical protein M5D96_012305, partial [Drosophila gunungcola]
MQVRIGQLNKHGIVNDLKRSSSWVKSQTIYSRTSLLTNITLSNVKETTISSTF